jgi:uncharacterized protein (TIGR01370 family)
MVRLVTDVAAYGRSRAGPDFGVLVLNAPELAARHPAYARTVSGIVLEETYIRALNDSTTEDERSAVEADAAAFRRTSGGRPVFTVDYTDDPGLARAAHDRAARHGFVSYVSKPSLDRVLNLGRGEPKCTPYV